MSEEKSVIFAEGFSFKRKDGSPDFVVGRMSVKVAEAVDFLGQYERNGWVNLDVKMSRKGNYYVELDQYIPQNEQVNSENRHPKATAQRPVENVEDESQSSDSEEDGLPF